MNKSQLLNIVPLIEIPKAETTPTDDLLALFRIFVKMEYLCEQQQGIGLSACQVGIPLNLFVVKRNTEYQYFLNCEYIGLGEKIKSIEGCLSLRDKYGELRRFEVERFPKIKIKGKRLMVSNTPSLSLLDIDQIEEDELYSIVFQHEIDHNRGREQMIDVIGKEIDGTFI